MTYRDDGDAALRRELSEVTERLADAEAEAREALRVAERERTAAKHGRIADKLGVAWRASVLTVASVSVIGGVGYGIHSCSNSEPPITRGIITDRFDDPAYTTPAYTTTVCSGTKVRTCFPVYHPPVHHPERWAIEISHGGRTRFVELPEEAWATTRVGGTWCEDPNDSCDLTAVERAR